MSTAADAARALAQVLPVAEFSYRDLHGASAAEAIAIRTERPRHNILLVSTDG